MPPLQPCQAAASIWATAGPKGASTLLVAMSLSFSGLYPVKSSCAGARQQGGAGFVMVSDGGAVGATEKIAAWITRPQLLEVGIELSDKALAHTRNEKRRSLNR
jgi:hypothetical protein